jgi:NADH dehydrogenase
MAAEAVYARNNCVVDAVGPEIFTFKQMVNLIGEKIGFQRPLVSASPHLALLAANALSMFVGDILLTREELDGLMAGLLVSTEPPLGKTRLGDWLEANKDRVGVRYASELKRHFA